MNGNGGLSAGDVLALSKNNDGIFGGEGFAGIIMLLIVAGLFGGSGFGWGNNSGITETFVDNRLLARDVFNTNTNVLESACQTQRDVLESKYANQVSDCGLSKEIMQNRYDNALQTQTLSSQIAQCCCDLRADNLANTQKVIDIIQQDKIDQLRDQVYTTNQALNNANLANTVINAVRPTPVPAYLSCSPYFAYNMGYGCNNGCGCGNATII